MKVDFHHENDFSYSWRDRRVFMTLRSFRIGIGFITGLPSSLFCVAPWPRPFELLLPVLVSSFHIIPFTLGMEQITPKLKWLKKCTYIWLINLQWVQGLSGVAGVHPVRHRLVGLEAQGWVLLRTRSLTHSCICSLMLDFD